MIDKEKSFEYQNLKNCFPHIEERVVDCWKGDRLELILLLDDGKKYVYDGLTDNIYSYSEPVKYHDISEVDEAAYREIFSDRLKRAMRNHCVTQAVLSDRSRISRQLINKYVNGKSMPSAYTLAKLAMAIDCTIEELVGLNDIFEDEK